MARHRGFRRAAGALGVTTSVIQAVRALEARVGARVGRSAGPLCEVDGDRSAPLSRTAASRRPPQSASPGRLPTGSAARSRPSDVSHVMEARSRRFTHSANRTRIELSAVHDARRRPNCSCSRPALLAPGAPIARRTAAFRDAVLFPDRKACWHDRPMPWRRGRAVVGS